MTRATHFLRTVRLRQPSWGSGGVVCVCAMVIAWQASVAAPFRCEVYPAVPPALSAEHARQPCLATTNAASAFLGNGFISVEISRRTGLILSVENRLTGECVPVRDDETGFAWTDATGTAEEWLAGRLSAAPSLELGATSNECFALFTSSAGAGTKVALVYTLKRDQFWIERRLSLQTADLRLDRLIYGRIKVPDSSARELRLGKFDSPRLISYGKGGVFAGVGWWFYEVNDGLYQNTGMEYETRGHFESEPWYVGVFQLEPGEPYPGWFWYKTFLSERKLAYDKQRAYALWNARSGYTFLPISNPDLLNFVRTASQIGLNGLTAGEVRGLAKATKLAATNSTTREVIDTFAAEGVSFGVHEGDVQASNWATEAALRNKLRAIDSAHAQGIRNLTVDFFRVNDRFGDHRRAAAFFRHIRDVMDYTECHLGMAIYGPQFQREVLINHPTDLSGFDISRFSSDWATLTGFRHSRREWQKRYDYLMPENGLFYFCTHYSNYPRRYLDPEPQQFLYMADAWRGLAYAFHDKFGFRKSVAAQAAFSTFYVFGFFDAHIPAKDAQFARAYLDWVRKNATVLNRGRVCLETEDVLVMSKVQDGRGGFFVLNYTPGRKDFVLKLHMPGAATIQQVYPTRGKPFRGEPSGCEVSVPGEQLAMFQIGDGFESLPPENAGPTSVDITDWKRTEAGWVASFAMPDIRAVLQRRKDSSLPQRLVSADQTETGFVMNKNSGKSPGKLPGEFLAAYGFEQEKFLPTWKAAPWAFADRVWLVYIPRTPPAITAPAPVFVVNGKPVTASPRVRYDPKGTNRPEKWDSAMWFVDVTPLVRSGAENELSLKTLDNQEPGLVYIALPPN